VERAEGDYPSVGANMLAAHDLIDEVIGWLADGTLLGPAAPAAIDRLRVAQTLLREHSFADDDAAPTDESTEAPIPDPITVVETEPAPNAWLDED
jgi:hypothetical protein